jgi:hypothetical protein
VGLAARALADLHAARRQAADAALERLALRVADLAAHGDHVAAHDRVGRIR